MLRYHEFKEKYIIYSKNNKIFLNDKIIEISGILSDKFDLLKRLLRNDIFFVKQFEDILVVCKKAKLLIYKDFKLEKEIPLKGSRILRNGFAKVDNYLFFGDYFSNKDRVPVNLYRVSLDTFEYEIFYQFNWIRHIHFVINDKKNPTNLIIGTGDLDSESGLYYLNLNDKTLIPIREGKQDYRAVSLLQVDNFFIWGSDDPNGENYIYKMDRDELKEKNLYKIDGPAYYSTMDKKGNLYIATTIEDRKRHKAIIYISEDNGDTWKIYKEFKKDIWSCKYFGYGVVEFLYNQENKKELKYNLIGLKELK